MKAIERVTVLGAGTMGARIAAHLANAGVPSFLLDMVSADADGAARNRVAQAGLDSLKKSKPAAFFEPALVKLITIGNFDDNLTWVAQSDWVIEAVVEDLNIKRSLLKKVEAARKPGTIVTSNTSGLPLHLIAEGFSDDFRRHWFGTHFFNPPRYMRLVELIATPESDRRAMEAIAHFCDLRLGKGVVWAKDTPNFIANRIGTFSVMNVMRLMQELDLSIEEVDAITGTAVGWPKSATFRTIDMVGLDVLDHVARNMVANAPLGGGAPSTPCVLGCNDERSDLKLPGFVQQMIEHRMLGDKTNGGFYKKIKSADGQQLSALDWKTLEYKPAGRPKFAALEMAKNVEDLGERLRLLIEPQKGEKKGDKAGLFLWTALSELWTYAAIRIGEIADSVVEIDRAMRLGFNWEMGPFELWDAAGVPATVERMRRDGKPVAQAVETLLASGNTSWYEQKTNTASGRAFFDFNQQAYRELQVPAGVWSVTVAKKSNGEVIKNPGASLIDLGDGVGCLEFHTKMNALGSDIIQLVTQALKPEGPGAGFDAFVITNDAPHFSAGANLMLLLLAAQEQEWDEIDLMVRAFQGMTSAIRHSPKPIVVAPFGMTLGGGCEVAIAGAARQAHAELYMGFAEPGVGLLPAGGGCKEMLVRALDLAEKTLPGGGSGSLESMDAIKNAFETVALAKISTSANEARNLGLLTEADQITMNRDRLLADAKTRALELARSGYQPAPVRSDISAPGESVLAALKLGIHLMRQGEYISDHDAKIGSKIAEVLCGGNVTPGTAVTEQYILDLEREGFKSLCGECKTLERIQHTLKTGKPLRN